LDFEFWILDCEFEMKINCKTLIFCGVESQVFIKIISTLRTFIVKIRLLYYRRTDFEMTIFFTFDKSIYKWMILHD